MGKRAYIAAPFEAECTSRPDKYYGVIMNAAYIGFLEAIEDTLVSSGWEPLLPHRESDWGRQYLQPSETARRCLDLVCACDLLVAYPKNSRGVHIEMGYAAALGKPILVILDEGEREAAMVAGLGSVTTVQFIRLADRREVKAKLSLALQSLFSENASDECTEVVD